MTEGEALEEERRHSLAAMARFVDVRALSPESRLLASALAQGERPFEIARGRGVAASTISAEITALRAELIEQALSAPDLPEWLRDELVAMARA